MKLVAKCSAYVSLSDQVHVRVCNPIPLRINGHNLTIFCIHIIIDEIYVGIVKLHFFSNLKQSYGP